MMNEVRLYAVLLVVLLVGAYLSWTYEPDEVDTSAAILLDVQPDQLERLELTTTTQTVSFAYRGSGASSDRYGWFEVERRGKKTAFVSNDDADKFLKKFAPLEAKRSLGRNLTGEVFKQTGLDAPKRRLTITAAGKTRVFNVGQRTHGAKDHYVMPEGSEEVFLLASRTLTELDLAKNKFMQRDVLVKPLRLVGSAVISTNGTTATVTHRNRAEPKTEYWLVGDEEKPNDAIGSFMLKMARLSIRSYPEDLTEFEKATPIIEISWRDGNGDDLGTTALYRYGEGNKATYYAKSDRNVRPGKIDRIAAAQLEKDLPSLLP